MSKSQSLSKWELHRDRRIKEKDERTRHWRRIKQDAYAKYGGNIK